MNDESIQTTMELPKIVQRFLDDRSCSNSERKSRQHISLKECIRIQTTVDRTSHDLLKLRTGSTAEGSHTFGSDVDFVLVDLSPAYHEKSCQHSRREIDLNFDVEKNNQSPGHVLIRTKKRSGMLPENLRDITTQLSGAVYLSSKKAVTSIKRVYQDYYTSLNNCTTKVLSSKGPSVPLLLEDDIKCDMTNVRLFHCPTIVKQWMSLRKGNWPSQNVKNRIALFPAFLAPVGQKGTVNEDLQWRLCFNLSEHVLVSSLNDTQFRVLVFLKLLKTVTFEPICKGVTSCLIKNIVFQLCDYIPVEYFIPNFFLCLVNEALHLLADGISNECVDYFMIPDRNLLKGKLTQKQKNNLLDTIDVFLDTGSYIEELHKIYECIDNYADNNKVESIDVAKYTSACLVDIIKSPNNVKLVSLMTEEIGSGPITQETTINGDEDLLNIPVTTVSYYRDDSVKSKCTSLEFRTASPREHLNQARTDIKYTKSIERSRFGDVEDIDVSEADYPVTNELESDLTEHKSRRVSSANDIPLDGDHILPETLISSNHSTNVEPPPRPMDSYTQSPDADDFMDCEFIKVMQCQECASNILSEHAQTTESQAGMRRRRRKFKNKRH